MQETNGNRNTAPCLPNEYVRVRDFTLVAWQPVQLRRSPSKVTSCGLINTALKNDRYALPRHVSPELSVVRTLLLRRRLLLSKDTLVYPHAYSLTFRRITSFPYRPPKPTTYAKELRLSRTLPDQMKSKFSHRKTQSSSKIPSNSQASPSVLTE